MTTQEFWAGDGGDQYTLRNDIDWRKRVTFWRDVIPADVETAFECGTNLGANLRAIRACRAIKTQGIELNQSAVDAAIGRGLAVQQGDMLRLQAVPMWDLTRDPPALLRPGLRCRFVQGRARLHPAAAISQPQPDQGLRIASTMFPLVFQDDGRPGQGGQGVEVRRDCRSYSNGRSRALLHPDLQRASQVGG